MKKIKEITIAFFATVLLWSLATSQNLSEVSFFVDLNISNIPQDYIISSRSDNKLNIQVKGPKSVLSKLTPFDFRASYKMPDIEKPGDFSFRLSPDDISVPSGVIEVKSVSPSSIQVYLEKTITKVLNINPEIIGTPADGFKKGRIELEPSRVTVKGPQQTLDKLEEINTEPPFDITGLDSPYRQKVNLVTAARDVTFIDVQHTTIEIIIEPIIVTKRLDNITVTTFPFDIPTKLIPETFTADFKGPKNLIDEVIQPGITAVIDIRDYNQGLKYLLLPVFPDLPQEIQVVDRNPKKITVKILKSGNDNRE